MPKTENRNVPENAIVTMSNSIAQCLWFGSIDKNDNIVPIPSVSLLRIFCAALAAIFPGQKILPEKFIIPLKFFLDKPSTGKYWGGMQRKQIEKSVYDMRLAGFARDNEGDNITHFYSIFDTRDIQYLRDEKALSFALNDKLKDDFLNLSSYFTKFQFDEFLKMGTVREQIIYIRLCSKQFLNKNGQRFTLPELFNLLYIPASQQTVKHFKKVTDILDKIFEHIREKTDMKNAGYEILRAANGKTPVEILISPDMTKKETLKAIKERREQLQTETVHRLNKPRKIGDIVKKK